nr:LLM class flavin-dependent oxidoreductase [Rhodococcus sp. LB1]
MHLGGSHISAWRDPDAPENAAMNFEAIKEAAETAERAKLHGLFLADSLALWQRSPETLARLGSNVSFEPFTLCAALSVVTERLGLILTGNTTYNEPYHLARKYASLDHLSSGRAGWNVVTSGNPAEGPNFGGIELDRERRYERAAEFVDVAQGLWDSWEDDAFVRDRESGIFHDADKLRVLDHQGPAYSVAGPLTVARPPQGHPVIAQAGTSPAGKAFAAQYAEIVINPQQDIEQARTFYREMKDAAVAAGRDRDDIKILSNIALIVGRTQAEADERMALLDSLVDPVPGLETLSGFLFHDLSVYPLDEPVPEIPVSEQGTQGIQAHMLSMIRKDNLTLRQATQLAARVGAVAFSADALADHIEEWVNTEASDGFNLVFTDLRGSLDVLAEHVVPELQRRGSFHHEYAGTTLRDNLGLRRPSHASTVQSV